MKSPSRSLLARLAPRILRGALGGTLLSAVADRFGWWGPPGTAGVTWGDWPSFVAYTAKVNGFLPAGAAPTLAFGATAAEIALGVGLLLGVFRRPVAGLSAVMPGAFALAMMVSFGVKAPLNYSVWVDAAAALLLAAWPGDERPTRAETSALA